MIVNLVQGIQEPQAEDSALAARKSLFTCPRDTRRSAGKDILRRSSDLHSMRHHLAQLSEENLQLRDTVDTLKRQCYQYEQELEQGRTERSSLLDYLSHFRSENQRMETKLEAYTEKIKKLEKANAELERTMQEQRESLLVRDTEQKRQRTQLTLLDLNLGLPGCTSGERVTSVGNSKGSKTPTNRCKKELFYRAETMCSSKWPRSSSTRKIYEKS